MPFWHGGGKKSEPMRERPPEEDAFPGAFDPEETEATGGKPPRRGFFARLRRAVALLSFALMALIVAGFALIFSVLPGIQAELENPRLLDRRAVTLLDAAGDEITTRGGRYAPVLPLKEMPDYLIQAFLAAEDQRFYAHDGFDVKGIARAAWANLQAGRFVQGGSTITQQLAKNVYLSSDRTLVRKFREALITLWLEQRYSKEEILTAYLNRIYLGAGTYGVEAAAQFYFDKPAARVTLSEAALLAGLPKAPSRLAPTSNLARAQARADHVLRRLVETGALSHGEVFAARSEPATIKVREERLGAQYFADWALEEAARLVPDHDGKIFVRTTLDPAMQNAAEAALLQTLEEKGPRAGFSQGAVLTLGLDGSVKAMAGGRSYLESQFNRAVQARRQPGSAFKPVVYLAALERGYGSSSIMIDEPVNIHGWEPENVSGRYLGAVSLSTALKHSLNTVAVRLSEEVGRDRVIKTARKLGLTSPLPALPSLALGTAEVTLLELTGAYLPFATDGLIAPPFAIAEITDEEGRKLYAHESERTRIISRAHAREMNAMLYGVIESGTGLSASLSRHMAAGKTGTSQLSRDAWFIGYTAHYLTGIWFGNDDDSPGLSGGGGIAAGTWAQYMTQIHKGLAPKPLTGVFTAPVVTEQPKEQQFFRALSRLFRSAEPLTPPAPSAAPRFRRGGETVRMN